MDWISFAILVVSVLVLVLGLVAYGYTVYLGGSQELIMIPVFGFVLLLVTGIVVAARKKPMIIR